MLQLIVYGRIRGFVPKWHAVDVEGTEMSADELSEMRPDELLDLATFLRKFEQRASGIMWLLGAGASRASGIRTANDMIWDFKARLYRLLCL